MNNAGVLTTRARFAWRTVQTLVWLVGTAVVAALLWAPDLGIHAFWNVLIPVAPALVAFAPGLWRNICPMASNALFLRHVESSARRRVPYRWQGRLLLMGVVLLFVIVPLRHVVLDTSGPATALVILALAAFGIVMGGLFEWKSGWCSGLCPVHPVERLYGSAPLVVPQNAHCSSCFKCVQPCAESTPAIDPLSTENGMARRVAGTLMVGGFAGFIWGWFQVPDYAGAEGWNQLGRAYAWPLLGTAVALALFLALRARVDGRLLRRAFAAAAIGCYYWYRLPALFGFGPFPGDGMLVDLRGVLPGWFPVVSRIATTALFAWWLVGRRGLDRSWLTRPSFAG